MKNKYNDHILKRHDALLEYSPVAIVMYDTDMNIIEASRKWLERNNFKASDAIGKNYYDLFPYIPERWKIIHNRCMEGFSEKCAYDILYQDSGEEEIVKWEINPWRNEEGEICGLIMFSEIITENVKRDNKIIRLNKELQLLNNVRDITINSKDEFDMIDNVCKEIINTGGYQLVWFGYAPDTINENYHISPLHKYGSAIHYLDNFVIDLSNEEHRMGPTATSLLTGKTLVNNDALNNESLKPWMENIKKYHLLSSINIPIKLKTEQVAVFVIYSNETNVFTEEEVEVLKRVVNGVSFAINNLQRIYEQKVAKIKQDKLIKDLNAQNRRLEEFTYLVSHNLRAKVANLLGLSTLIADTNITVKERKELYKGIRQTSVKLDEVIRDLNSILQVKDHLVLNIERVEFDDMLADVKCKLVRLFPERKITINSDFTSASYLYSDSYYVYEILYQLLQSLVNPKNEKQNSTIYIFTQMIQGKIKLCIRDDYEYKGLNIREGMNDIFEIHSKLYQHLTELGIKLFYVNALVENLGGKLNVESMEKNKVIFIIDMPFE